MAAVRRWPGPLALVSVYFVASMTENPNEWQNHTLYSILIVLCVIGGGAWLEEQKERAPMQASERETVA